MVTRHQDLDRLIRVDRVDRKIHKLRKRIDGLPSELDRDRAEVAQLQRELDQAEQATKDTKKTISRAEGEQKVNLDQIGKYRVHQNAAKTNEEYSTLKRQIEALEAKNGELDDVILIAMEKLDDLGTASKAKAAKLKAGKGVLAKEETQLQGEIDVLRKEEAKLLADREELLAEVKGENRRMYERIMEKTKARALAPLVGRKCQSCFVDVPTGDMGRVSMGQDVVTCRSCALILYSDD
ncbi:MAG: zinc ribbon domain-containing protein [Planctomycetota bacterium]|jgi:predicted  nucleic acid-binding Zn-ribbon protein